MRWQELGGRCTLMGWKDANAVVAPGTGTFVAQSSKFVAQFSKQRCLIPLLSKTPPRSASCCFKLFNIKVKKRGRANTS